MSSCIQVRDITDPNDIKDLGILSSASQIGRWIFIPTSVVRFSTHFTIRTLWNTVADHILEIEDDGICEEIVRRGYCQGTYTIEFRLVHMDLSDLLNPASFLIDTAVIKIKVAEDLRLEGNGIEIISYFTENEKADELIYAYDQHRRSFEYAGAIGALNKLKLLSDMKKPASNKAPALTIQCNAKPMTEQEMQQLKQAARLASDRDDYPIIKE